MEIYVREAYAWRLVLVVIAVYFVGFALFGVIKAAWKGELVIDRKLSISRILSTGGDELGIPIIVTLVGFFLAVLGTGTQEPRGDDLPLGLMQVFASLIVQVHIAMAVVVIVVGVCYSSYTIWCTVRRWILSPIFRCMVYVYRAVRPMVPIRW